MMSLADVREKVSEDRLYSLAHRTIEIVGTVLLFTAAFWYDFLKFYFGLDVQRSLTLCAGAFLCLIAIALKGDFSILRRSWLSLAFLCYCVIAIGLQIGAGADFGQNLTFYVAPLIGFLLLPIERRLVLTLLIGTIAASALMQIGELLTCHYFYVWDGPGGHLDEFEWMGSTRTIRAKGLFAGPLSGYYLCLLTLLLTSMSRPVLAISALSSILSVSKAGLITTSLLIGLSAFDIRQPGRSLIKICVAIAILAGVGGALRHAACALPPNALSPSRTQATSAAVDPAQLNRLRPAPNETSYDFVSRIARTEDFNILAYARSVIDVGSSVNEARRHYWQVNLDRFAAFSTFHKLFGDPHYSYRVSGEGTESSILKELMDYGIVGFIFACLLKGSVVIKLSRTPKILIFFLGYLLNSALQPIHTNFGNSMLLWLFIFYSLSRSAPAADSTRRRPIGDAAP